MVENNEKDEVVVQSQKLFHQLDDVVTIFAAENNGVSYGVPILAALSIIDKYAKNSGSSLQEILELQVDGMKKREAEK